MSRTLYVNFRDNGFWAYDVPSSIYLKFLIDAAVEFSNHRSQVWLTEAIQHWRVNALMSEFGLHLDDHWDELAVKDVIELCATASQAVRNHGNVSHSDVLDWDILDGQSIFLRGHDPVPYEPIARIGDAIVALLTNALPIPPVGHWWFFALADEIETIEMKS